MNKHWRLTITGEFSAAHAINNYPGKCERLHGHNFTVRISIEGEKLDPETGMLVDFKILKAGLKDILSRLDHVIINEMPSFKFISPSSENLAEYIWDQYTTFLETCSSSVQKVKINEVTVSEKNGQEASFFIS